LKVKKSAGKKKFLFKHDQICDLLQKALEKKLRQQTLNENSSELTHHQAIYDSLVNPGYVGGQNSSQRQLQYFASELVAQDESVPQKVPRHKKF
jgi:hypothetical protein